MTPRIVFESRDPAGEDAYLALLKAERERAERLAADILLLRMAMDAAARNAAAAPLRMDVLYGLGAIDVSRHLTRYLVEPGDPGNDRGGGLGGLGSMGA